MSSTTTIQFLKNREINKERWDQCIHHSFNGLMYARAFYLDRIAAGWSALTDGNYEWVLPVTKKSKYGISYLYQPPFTQQLGVFSKPGVTVPYKEIIDYLQNHYRFCECNWNFGTPAIHEHPLLETETATNFILDLSNSYDSLANNYHTDLTKNLKRSRRFQHIYRVNNNYDNCIDAYRQYYGKRVPHVKEKDYENFRKICAYCYENNMIICREVVDQNESLLACVLLLAAGKRLYNMMNTTTVAGRKTGANHFLLNAIIAEFAGNDVVLDFEGSDLPGVKTFYENFGGINQPYFKIKYNLLPWPIKALKG